MSQVDRVFGPIPGPLIKQWGTDMAYVPGESPGTYDPTTGTVTQTQVPILVRAVISKVTATEAFGNLQATDLKLYLDPGQLNGVYINTDGHFEFTEGDCTRRAKVLSVSTYRGEGPVLFVCIVRPQ